jgi:hypothetical protein
LLIVNARHLEPALTVFIDHDKPIDRTEAWTLAPPNGLRAIGNWTG